MYDNRLQDVWEKPLTGVSAFACLKAAQFTAGLDHDAIEDVASSMDVVEVNDGTTTVGSQNLVITINGTNDVPTVTAGAPISIGWECVDRETLPVNDFEAQRPVRRACARLPRLGAGQRQDILLNAGVPLMDIQQRTEECDALRLDWQQSMGAVRARAFGIPMKPKAQKPKFHKRIWKRIVGRRSI